MTVRAPINLGVLAGARIPHFDAPHVCSGGPVWSATAIPLDRYSGIAYGNGRFVATGHGQAGVTPTRTAYSLDKGKTWASGGTIANLGNNTPFGLRFGNGIFLCAMSGAGSPVTTDGLSWTTRTGSGVFNLQAIEFGNGLFLAVSGSSPLVKSTVDGNVWASHTTPEVFTRCFWDSYRNRWLGISDTTVHTFTSPDLDTWTQRGNLPSAVIGQGISENDMAQATSGPFAGTIIAAYNAGVSFVSYTDDGGNTWGASAAIVTNQVTNAIFGNGVFIITKALGGYTDISSNGGRNFNAANSLTMAKTWLLAYNSRNSYVAVGAASGEDTIANVGDC